MAWDGPAKIGGCTHGDPAISHLNDGGRGGESIHRCLGPQGVREGEGDRFSIAELDGVRLHRGDVGLLRVGEAERFAIGIGGLRLEGDRDPAWTRWTGWQGSRTCRIATSTTGPPRPSTAGSTRTVDTPGSRNP